MHVRCLLFGRYAEAVGTSECNLEVEPGADVATVIGVFRKTVFHGELIPEATMVAINREHVLPSHPVNDGDELAFLPPLAGG